MDIALILGGVALVHLAGAASPGPSFVLVTRTAAGRGRAPALWMAAGIGLGAVIWAAAALFGLTVAFAAAPWLAAALKLGGAAYLVWIAIGLWRHAGAPVEADAAVLPLSAGAAFRQALLVQLSNPKVIVFFGSVFAAVAPQGASPGLLAAILLNVLLVEGGWYAAVAAAFSAAPVRTRYMRAKAGVDRVCGGLMGLMGARLALAA